MEVCSRKVCISSACRPNTSSVRYSSTKRLLPVKSSMKCASCSIDRPWAESAAKCSPAIQPSVCASSAVIWPAESGKSITSVRNTAASSELKRRSAARTSARAPRTRRRARGNGGSRRVAMTRCSQGGKCSNRKTRAAWIDWDSMTW